MERIWNELEIEVKKRGLPERTMLALSDATVGFKVRNATYRSAAMITDTLASRDLRELVKHGLLAPEGEKRGRAYLGAKILRDIRERTREPRTPDPALWAVVPSLAGAKP